MNILEYKILLTENPSPLITFAARELQEFVLLASGIELEIANVTEPRHRYISIDRTSLSTGIALPDTYNSSGYTIRTVDGNYIILGKSEHGSLYGVYELLRRLIDLEVYAADEVKFRKTKKIPFRELDISYCPKIEFRHVAAYSTKVSERTGKQGAVTANRLKCFAGGYKMDGNTSDWYTHFWGGGMFAHTSFKILPPEKNEQGALLHQDWYNKAGTQLCLSNAEMTERFIENLKAHIAQHAGSPFFSIGIEDNSSPCDCAGCQKSNDRFGGAAGTYLKFIKTVALEIDRWQKKALPDSNFKLVAFSYLWTKNPPCKVGADGNYAPYDDSLVLPDNVVIFNAPIDACGLHRLDEPCNRDVLERFKKWQLFAKRSFVWDYHHYYDNVLLFFPGIWSYKSNILLYEQFHTDYLFNELQTADFCTGFLDLKQYLLAKLSFDSSLDDRFLIEDFCRNYYKAAASKILQYLETLKKHYESLEVLYPRLGSRGYHVSYDVVGHPDVLTEKHFPKALVLQCEALLHEALASADNDLIAARVKREQIFIKYLLLELHTYYCCAEELDSRLTEFEKLVAELGDVYCYSHWFIKGTTPESSPHNIQSLFNKMKCRYPARADRE